MKMLMFYFSTTQIVKRKIWQKFCEHVISNTATERKTEARFLGVIIDKTLAWTRHVKTVLSKMSRYVGIMYKIKSFYHLKHGFRFTIVLYNHI